MPQSKALYFVAFALTLLSIFACKPSPYTSSSGFRHETISYRGYGFDVVTIDLKQTDLDLFWKDINGNPYRNFEALKLNLQKEGDELLFATNAGIYSDNFTPGGLHIENWAPQSPINFREGEGNFHLLPNGIFYLGKEGAGVVESHQFLEDKIQAKIASQSGPMLVINGELHSSFKHDSENRHIRNGVGVNQKGEIVFVLSRNVVSFYQFARLFRDKLDCNNALYLDGTISRFYLPEKGLTDTSGDFVGIFGVVKRNPNRKPVHREPGSQPGSPEL